jgi:large subunit ribosomal protein L18
MAKKNELRQSRAAKVRRSVKAAANGRPRLSVHRSLTNIYAQVIDDAAGRTLASASSLDKDMRDKLKAAKGVDVAKAVGSLLAERAKKAGVKSVVFDRGRFIYHGRVKALAEAARAGGLEF